MTPVQHRESAQIIAFPGRARSLTRQRAAQPQPEAAPRVKIAYGGWYHEAAIEESKQAGQG